MKNYIIFLAFVILGTISLCYNEDCNRYIQEQMHLKALTEDCAAHSMLEIDMEAYSKGNIIIMKEQAITDIKLHVENYLEKICKVYVKGWKVSAWIYDDEGIYYTVISDGIIRTRQRLNTDRQKPSMKIKMSLDVEDIIRGDFAEIKKISRETVYELVLP